MVNRSPFDGRHDPERGLSTAGRRGRAIRTRPQPAVGNACCLIAPTPHVVRSRLVSATRIRSASDTPATNAAAGVAVTDVLDDRLGRLGAGSRVHAVYRLDLHHAVDGLHRRTVPGFALALRARNALRSFWRNSLRSFSRQSPLRLIDTVMPRAVRAFRSSPAAYWVDSTDRRKAGAGRAAPAPPSWPRSWPTSAGCGPPAADSGHRRAPAAPRPRETRPCASDPVPLSLHTCTK